jgi:hypothetical protein
MTQLTLKFTCVEVLIVLNLLLHSRLHPGSFLAGGGIFVASIGASNSRTFVGSYMKIRGILSSLWTPLGATSSASYTDTKKWSKVVR